MTLLDIKTVLFLSTISALAISMAMLAVAHRFPGYVGHAFKLWGIGLGLSGINHLLLLYRENLPGFLIVIVANTLIIITLSLYYFAIKELRQEIAHKTLPVILTLFQILAFCYFYYVDNNTNMRFLVLAITSITMIFMISKCFITSKSLSRRLISWIVVAITSLIMASIIYMVVEVLFTNNPIVLPISNNTPQAFLFVGEFLGTSVVPLLFVLIAGDEFIVEISKLASHDSLTGIYNRRAFHELTRKILLRLLKNKQQNSLLALDLDYFKTINDQFGHEKGDEVLLCSTKAIQSCLRETDIFARYGGEEFSVFLPGANEIEAKRIAERLRKAISEMKVSTPNGYITLTISIGIVTCSATQNNLEAMMHAADKALYQAKTNGRNQVCITN
ncbi:MAG: GGDEF domain-containing protein [Proteobacteria bacterium]|nr:GGDEF domain-containing protein [Pseudomonadota bacterium]MDE3208607.1 GGDEF domain-containing protein [Pseudomonadota bacterium]